MSLKNLQCQRVDVAFRYSALGDVVLCTGFVQKHAATVGSALYFVTQPEFAGLAKAHFPKHPGLHVYSTRIKGWSGLFAATRSGYRLAKEIVQQHQPREINFYDLHNVAKSQAFALGLWLGLSSSTARVLLCQNSKRSFLRQLSIFLGKDLLPLRWAYRDHQNLLDGPQIFEPHLRNDVHIPKENIIMLAPAASKWKKEWPASKWEELIRHLKSEFSEYEIHVVSPAGHALTQAFKTSLASVASTVEWYDDLKTNELSGFAAGAAVCICSNSAWLHLCEANQTPVVALEGPIVDGFGFSPFLPRSHSLQVNHLKCRPCTKHGGGNCQLRGKDFHACMTRISTAEVLNALQKILRPEIL